MNKKMIAYILGKLLMVEGLLMLCPGIVALLYQEVIGVIYTAVAVLLMGIGKCLSYRIPKKKNIYAKEGFIIVFLSWLLFSVFGALPFYIAKEIPSYIDALFEMISGFTATGASVVKDVDVLSYASLFWRNFSHWIGGMGILVFTVAIVPVASGRSLHILRAEMPGPVVGKLVAKIGLTARILYVIYTVLTLLQIVLLLFGGMPLFESILTGFGTAGTGGFATTNHAISVYTNAYIEGVILVFMFIFSINFNLLYLLIIGNYALALKNEELRWYLGCIVICVVAITLNITNIYGSYLEALRYASFQVISIITTTAYFTADYTTWPMFSQIIILLLMFIGGNSGSTSGGIKVSRIVMLGKNACKEIKKLVHPKSVVTVDFEGQAVEPRTITNIHAYFILYVVIFVSSLLFVALENLDFHTTFTAVLACLNNMGAGFSEVGPTTNFSTFSDLSKLVLSFGMLAGRLEIFPVLIVFSSSFWRE